jgi:hypothetical protein
MRGSQKLTLVLNLLLGWTLAWAFPGGGKPIVPEAPCIGPLRVAAVAGEKIGFAASGGDAVSGIERIRLQIYSLRGSLVYDSGFRGGTTVQWNLQTQSGAVAANGVYLFVLTARDREGRLFHRIGRIVVLR